MRIIRWMSMLTAMAAAPAVQAQQAGTIELGGFVHASSIDKNVSLGTSSFGVGARLGFFALRNLSVEGEYSVGSISSNVRGVNAWMPFRGMVVYSAPLAPKVKLLLGAGYKLDRWQGDTTTNQYEDAFTAEVGIRVCLKNAWTFRSEVSGDYNPSPNYQFAEPHTSKDFGLRVGVSKFFGRGANTCEGPAAPARPAAPPVAPPPVVPPPVTPPPVRPPVTPPPVTPPPVTPPPVRPPVTPPPPARPPQPPPREMFRLEGVFFDFDKATLKPEGRTKLDEAVATLNRYSDMRVEIQGHTDSLGTEAYNQGLSERRAKAVHDYLVSKGISASRLTTRGFGETQPVADNGTKEGRAQNRRVVLIEVR